MGDRRVVVEVKVNLIIDVEEGVAIDNVINNMNYSFTHSDEQATIIDTEIVDFNVMDSR
jgi:hypothetical protein